jgi:hypothetical protein
MILNMVNRKTQYHYQEPNSGYPAHSASHYQLSHSGSNKRAVHLRFSFSSHTHFIAIYSHGGKASDSFLFILTKLMLHVTVQLICIPKTQSQEVAVLVQKKVYAPTPLMPCPYAIRIFNTLITNLTAHNLPQFHSQA